MMDIKDWRNWIFLTVCAIAGPFMALFSVRLMMDMHFANVSGVLMATILTVAPSRPFNNVGYWVLRTAVFFGAFAVGFATMAIIQSFTTVWPRYVSLAVAITVGSFIAASITAHTTERLPNVTTRRRIMVTAITSCVSGLLYAIMPSVMPE